MGTLAKVLIGLTAVVTLLGIITIASVIGTNNEAVQNEAGIKAQYAQNQNNYDNYWKKVKEAAQVTDMYAADLKKVYDSAIQGRYGAGGSKAVFQFLKEQNPSIDASMYTKIQQIIEAGRNSFEADQKTLLDKKRVYEVQLNSFPSSIVARTLGFPRIDLSKYDIVTSDETSKAFESKKSAPLKVRE